MVAIKIGSNIGALMEQKESETDELLEIKVHLSAPVLCWLAIRTDQISVHWDEI